MELWHPTAGHHTMPRDVTSIEIKKSTWRTLNRQKDPGDSFDDVIQRLLARPEPDHPTPSDDTDDATVCPDCGEVFDSVPELLEHIQSVPSDH